MYRPKELIRILISNSFPLLGLLIFKWDVSSVLFYFLLDSVMVGAFMVLYKWPRALNSMYFLETTEKDRVQGPVGDKNNMERLIFTGVYVPFMLVLAGVVFFTKSYGSLTWWQMAVALGVSWAYHVVDCLLFVKFRDFEKVTAGQLVEDPFKRAVIALFVVIIAGGKDSTIVAIVLSALSFVIDVWFYRYRFVYRNEKRAF